MNAAAVEASSQKPGARLIFVRILCLMSLLVTGPLVGASILTCAVTTFAAISGEEISVSNFWQGWALGAVILGVPVVVGVIVLMLPFLRRPRLSLSLILATAAPSTIASVLLTWPETYKDMLLSEGMPIFLALSLTSVAICWRLTQRWHSPA